MPPISYDDIYSPGPKLAEEKRFTIPRLEQDLLERWKKERLEEEMAPFRLKLETHIRRLSKSSSNHLPWSSNNDVPSTDTGMPSYFYDDIYSPGPKLAEELEFNQELERWKKERLKAGKAALRQNEVDIWLKTSIRTDGSELQNDDSDDLPRPSSNDLAPSSSNDIPPSSSNKVPPSSSNHLPQSLSNDVQPSSSNDLQQSSSNYVSPSSSNHLPQSSSNNAPYYANRFVGDSYPKPNLRDILRQQGQVVGVYQRALLLLLAIVDQLPHSEIIKSDIVVDLVDWLSPRHSITDEECKNYVFEICQLIAQRSDDGRKALLDANILPVLSHLASSQKAIEVISACKILKALAHTRTFINAIITANLKKAMENIASPFRKSTLQSKEDKWRAQASARDVLETIGSIRGHGYFSHASAQTITTPQKQRHAATIVTTSRSASKIELPEAESCVSPRLRRRVSGFLTSPELSNDGLQRTRSLSESDQHAFSRPLGYDDPQSSGDTDPQSTRDKNLKSNSNEDPQSSSNNLSWSSSEQRPSMVVKQQPSTVDERRPSSSTVIMTKQQPSTVDEQRPSSSTVIKERPSTVDERCPSTVIEDPRSSSNDLPQSSSEGSEAAGVSNGTTSGNMFSSNSCFTGGSYFHVGGDAHFSPGPSFPVSFGFMTLYRNISASAFHDSRARCPPPRCHPSTRKDILVEIMDHVTESPSSSKILLLFGSEGTGKSAIAQTIAEYCKTNGTFGASFFFSRVSSERNTDKNIIATLAYQLCLTVPELKLFIAKAVEDDLSTFQKDMDTQIGRLIIDPIIQATNEGKVLRYPILIVIDGLDECEGEKEQCAFLRAISSAIGRYSLPLYFFITSRQEGHIVNWSNEDCTLRSILDLDQNHIQTERDIEAYICSEFERIRSVHHIPESFAWPSQANIRMVVSKTNMLFSRASEIMAFIDQKNGPSPETQLEIILQTSGPGVKYNVESKSSAEVLSGIQVASSAAAPVWVFPPMKWWNIGGG